MAIDHVIRPTSGYSVSEMAADSVQQQYPPYVTTSADRTRWDRCREVVRESLGPDAGADDVWMGTQAIYHNRTDFPD